MRKFRESSSGYDLMRRWTSKQFHTKIVSELWLEISGHQNISVDSSD